MIQMTGTNVTGIKPNSSIIICSKIQSSHSKPSQIRDKILDKIFISELKVQTKLGVPEWERMVPQTVVLDIEIGHDLSKAGKSDAIADTIDYGAIVTRIRETLAGHSFQLVEALAEHVCELIFKEFGVKEITIKISKPGIIAGVRAVGVKIERTSK